MLTKENSCMSSSKPIPPESFVYEMTHNRYNLVITDIKLPGTVTDIDLLQSIEDPST